MTRSKSRSTAWLVGDHDQRRSDHEPSATPIGQLTPVPPMPQ